MCTTALSRYACWHVWPFSIVRLLFEHTSSLPLTNVREAKAIGPPFPSGIVCEITAAFLYDYIYEIFSTLHDIRPHVIIDPTRSVEEGGGRDRPIYP